MSGRVTIVMYHFVRDLKNSRYPEIKGLDLVDFVEQVEYIRKYYEPITMEDLINAARSDRHELPHNSILLTFDDGYVDHFTNVFPVLNQLGIQGAFFPPARPILEHQVLDVNKIHFILATVKDKSHLIQFIFSAIEEGLSSYGLERPEVYYEKLAKPNEYDTADVVFIKRVLQRALPEEFRGRIVDKLFTQFVTDDEQAFAKELYMTVDQLRHIRSSGMHIGNHSYNHYWMNTLDSGDQSKEIDRSLEFLGTLGCDLQSWAMCYPYGGYDESLLDVLEGKRCAVGLTTEVAIADLATHHPFTLPRINTNDLPKNRDAPPNEWTLQTMPMK